jgi:nucleotidyltransferase/DNA polymerase involved in DNA repair
MNENREGHTDQRQHYRAQYPSTERPMLQMQGKTFLILDISERGISSAMSYEEKARGVTRGMRLSEVTRLSPDGFFLSLDYETYSLLSKQLPLSDTLHLVNSTLKCRSTVLGSDKLRYHRGRILR